MDTQHAKDKWSLCAMFCVSSCHSGTRINDKNTTKSNLLDSVYYFEK